MLFDGDKLIEIISIKDVNPYIPVIPVKRPLSRKDTRSAVTMLVIDWMPAPPAPWIASLDH